MKVDSIAFIYDHRYYIANEDQIFSSGPMSLEAWKRYLEVSGRLVVIGTLIEKSKEIAVENLNRSDLPNVKFVSFPYISSIKSFLRNMIFINTGLENKLIKENAIAARLPGELPYNAIRIAKKNNIPYWVEVVGCPWDAYWNHGSFVGKFLALFAYLRQKKAVWNAKYVIYVTEFFLQKRYPTKGKSINATNAIIPDLKEETLEHKKKLLNGSDSNENLVIGMIGSFDVKYKGHLEIIKALAKVKSILPSFQLLMVGPGNSTWVTDLAIKYGLEENIQIIGKLKSGMEIESFLDQLHLYVHPSKQEGLPRSIIEAMSRGCPVLGSTTGGIPELLQKEVLHKTGDYHTLAIQLTEFLNNKEKLLDQCLINFNTAKKYQYSKLNERRKEFFQSILNKID